MPKPMSEPSPLPDNPRAALLAYVDEREKKYCPWYERQVFWLTRITRPAHPRQRRRGASTVIITEFRSIRGHCRVPQRWPNNPKLAAWVSDQRERRKHDRIDPEHVRILDELGFDWDPINNLWDHMFDRLADYKSRFGHTNVPRDFHDRELVNWVRNQRKDYQLGRPITKARATRLDDLGFVWKFITQTPWDTMYSHLVAFHKERGNCDVPQRWTENLKLGRWVNTQRWRASRLSPEQRKKLDDIGFTWDARTRATEQRALM